jgi:type I restriction enzyme S subunit
MENKIKIKPSYNSGIPFDWKFIEFGEIFNFQKTYSFSREQLTEEKTFEKIQNIHYGDIHSTFENEIVDYLNEPRIPYIKDGLLNKDDIENEYFPLLKDGDLIIADASEDYEGIAKSIELTNINGNKVIGGLHTFVARDTSGKTEPGFRTYLLKNQQVIREIRRIATGFSVFGISKNNIARLKLLLPPLIEQKNISKILSTWDGAINRTQKLINQKELQKKWLMQNLLSGKKRLRGFKGEWKEVKIKNIFRSIDRINDGFNGHSIMTISSKLGLVLQEDKFDRVIAGESLKKYTQLKKGDFAYNKGNSKTYQTGCIYQLEENESALVPFVYICFSPTDLIDSKFYKHWFLAHGLDRQLKKIITSGARGDGLLNVNTDDFFNLKVPYPPIEEQSAIAEVFQSAEKELELLRSKLEKLREQKRGLMQMLLTGEKRVKQFDL